MTNNVFENHQNSDPRSWQNGGTYIAFGCTLGNKFLPDEIEFLDVSWGLYCPQHIYGLPVLFPNINFPVLLFYLHSFVITRHKRMPVIVYEVSRAILPYKNPQNYV
ncbi:unnamed protein product [Heligmosomoides polygyrus]|uniref:Uncharacterized protein n=1 Tax=Heligmosomoides polygyrus TaxID=6339 RepID=A0A3P7TCR9_HELPZ|nr:unnamed protein product [Heligmosomoides polygyrus]